MQSVSEREALLRLFFQYLSLGHGELAQCVLLRLQSVDADASRQLLQQLLTLSALPFEYSTLPSHQSTRIFWSILLPLSHSEQPQERLLVLKSQLQVLTDSLLSESEGQIVRTDIGVIKDAIDTLSERLLPTHRLARRRSVDGSSIQSALARSARSCPHILAAMILAIQSSRLSTPVPKEVTQFTTVIERSCLAAMDGAIRGGKRQEVFQILSHIQGRILNEAEYQRALQLLTQHDWNPTTALDLTQAALSNGVPFLSAILQREMDTAMMRSDEALSAKELFFPEQAPRWKSFGFQEARVHGWHMEGMKLGTVLKEIGKSRFEVLRQWQPGNKRLISLAALMGWDLLSAQNTASTYPLKACLLETVYPKVAAGKRSEFAGAVASLYAKLRFSELLSQVLKHTPSACNAGSILTKLSISTPQQILSEHIQNLDSRFLHSLAAAVSSIALSEQLPVVRDLQLVLSSGVISAVLAFLAVVGDILNGHGEVPAQELWLAELSELTASIHACLCGMQGTYHHSWVLSTLQYLLQIFLKRPDVLSAISVTFMACPGAKQQSSLPTSSGIEALKTLRDLVDVLYKSSQQMQPKSDMWLHGAARAHWEAVDAFYAHLLTAMDVLLQTGTRNLWKFMNRGNWRELGGYLSLPCEVHLLLMAQVTHFESDMQNLISWSEWLSQKSGSTEQSPRIEYIPTVLDVIIRKKLNAESSQQLLNLAIDTLTHSSEAAEGLLNQNVLQLCQQLHATITGSANQYPSSTPVADIFVLGSLSGTHQLVRTGSGVSVRKILEHLKGVTRLRDALRDLRRGQLRYLSGLLHNLSRALSADMSEVDSGAFLEVAGFGPDLNRPQNMTEEEGSPSSVSYLALMVHYLAEVGDIISTMDDGPTEGHNYFAMLQQSPQQLLSTLIGNCTCANDTDHVIRVAEVLGVDLAHEVLTTWVSPVYPPHDSEKLMSPVLEESRRMPTLDAMKELIAVAPVRVLVACALASLQKQQQDLERGPEESETACFHNIYEGRKPESIIGCLARAFEIKEEGQFLPLQNWVLAQHQLQQQEYDALDGTAQPQTEDEAREQISLLLTRDNGLRQAMKLADKVYDGQPPDDILLEIVAATVQFPRDDEPDGFFFLDVNADSDPLNTVPISWVACLKMKDKTTAHEAAASRVHSWSLERAIEFYSLQDTPLADQCLKKLRLYQRILSSSLAGEFHEWVDVDALFERDSAQLVRKLLTAGAVDYALEVTQSRDLPHNLKGDVYYEHIQSLGMGSASTGSGPLAVIRFLKSLSPPDAFLAAMRVLTAVCPVNLSRLLVQYLVSIKHKLSPECVVHLEQTKLGIAALRCLPQQWVEKCARLVETPSLIVESLIMAQQIVSLKKMLEEVPSLRNDRLLISYARKALGLSMVVERASCWMEGGTESPRGGHRAESSQASIQTKLATRISSNLSEVVPGVGLVPMTVLTGETLHDEQIRQRQTFRALPNLTLFRVLLDLLSSADASVSAAIHTAIDLANTHLSQSYGELEWNAIVAQEFQQGVNVCLEVLSYAEMKLNQTKAAEEPRAESSRSAADESMNRTGSPFAIGPSRMRGIDGGLRVEVELLQKILVAGIQASLMDLRDQMRCEALLHRLVTAEHYHLAVQTARQCLIDERPYWEAWVIASIQEGSFMAARERVPYVFCLPAGVQMDSSRIRMESRQAAIRLVRVLETTCPVDMPAFYTLHHSLRYSRLGSMFRQSARGIIKLVTRAGSDMDSPLAPDSCGIHGGMRRRDMVNVAASSTLIGERIQFCEELLATYAPSLLIPFMFRHSRGDIACQVMYPVGMDDDVGPSTRGYRRRERASSDRAVSLRTSISRDRRGGSSISSVPSEIASESDQPSPRTAPLQRSTSVQMYPSKSFSTATGEGSSQKQSGNWTCSKQLSLPQNYGSTVASRQLPPLGQGNSSNDLIRGVESQGLAREVENVHQICDLSVRYMTVEDMVNVMVNGGTRGKRALTEACTYTLPASLLLLKAVCCAQLKALNRLDAAGETCTQLSWKSSDVKAAIEFLASAKVHFQEALSVVQRRREVIDRVTIVKTQAELTTLIARTTLQLLIYKELQDKPEPSVERKQTPKQYSMFAESDEPTEEDHARRMGIVQWLLLRDFSLGFRVIFEFRLSETEAYTNTVASMALQRKHKAVLDLMNNIKGTISDHQQDRILLHAVSAYVAQRGVPEDEGWTFWFAEGLTELMASPHSKVRAFLKLKNIEAAFKLARLHGAQEDLNLVMEAAEQDGYRAIVRNCERILGRVHVRTAS